MNKQTSRPWSSWGDSLREGCRNAFRAALPALLCAGCQLREPRPLPAFPSAVSIPLSRSNENKLLLRAKALGGHARMMLDTGSPITCADQSQGSLFHFAPFAGPVTVVMNGQLDRMALIPQLEFGGVTVKNCAAVLLDISSSAPPQQRSACEGILGLGELRRLRAILDFGAPALFIPRTSVLEPIPVGWRAVPMRLLADHLVVPVTIRGVPTLFIVDTGSPLSLLDSALCRSQRIPVKKQYTFTLSALHYQTKAGQLGMIPDLHIGTLGIGQTPVGVCDISKIMGPQLQALGVTGLLGSHTLERLKAIIDCGAMQLYIQHP